MPLWLLAILAFFHICSILIFLLVRKHIHHVTNSYIRILGSEHHFLIKTPSLWVIQLMYISLLIASFGVSYFLFTQ